MLQYLAAIPLFLLIISIIVTFHEYGHYSVARLFKTRIERFSVGFGKVLLMRVDKRGVEWCLSAIPLGGYVKFAGDDNIASAMPGPEELEAARAAITAREGPEAVKDYFNFKPIWQRALIIVAGPVYNFVLAIAAFTLLFAIIGDQVGRPTVANVLPNSPASRAGLLPGDVIRQIDGRTVTNGLDVAPLIAYRANTAIPIVIERNKRSLTLTVTPERGVVDLGAQNQGVTGGKIGIQISDKVEVRPLNPAQAFVRACQETWNTLDRTFTYIGRIFVGKEKGDQISGIIGMTKATADMTMDPAMDKLPLDVRVFNILLRIIVLIATISIGVGFLNLLPIPVLDGGHLAILAYQGVTRKALPIGIQNAAFRIAVVLILGLMLYAAWNDINRIGLVKALMQTFS